MFATGQPVHVYHLGNWKLGTILEDEGGRLVVILDEGLRVDINNPASRVRSYERADAVEQRLQRLKALRWRIKYGLDNGPCWRFLLAAAHPNVDRGAWVDSVDLAPDLAHPEKVALAVELYGELIPSEVRLEITGNRGDSA